MFSICEPKEWTRSVNHLFATLVWHAFRGRFALRSVAFRALWACACGAVPTAKTISVMRLRRVSLCECTEGAFLKNLIPNTFI